MLHASMNQMSIINQTNPLLPDHSHCTKIFAIILHYMHTILQHFGNKSHVPQSDPHYTLYHAPASLLNETFSGQYQFSLDVMLCHIQGE